MSAHQPLDELSLRINAMLTDDMTMNERGIILAAQMLVAEFQAAHPGLTIIECDKCGGEIDCQNYIDDPLENCRMTAGLRGWVLWHFDGACAAKGEGS